MVPSATYTVMTYYVLRSTWLALSTSRCSDLKPNMHEHRRIQKIISGGQTGAGRAGLDFAIERGILHGG